MGYQYSLVKIFCYGLVSDIYMSILMSFVFVGVRAVFVLLLVKSFGALDRLTLYGIKQPFARLRNK